MCCRFARCVTVLVCLAVVVGWGCSRRPARLHPPGIDASAAGALAMKQYDTDGDGKVSGEELEKAPSLKQALGNLDLNGDGAVSASEVTARIKNWQETKLGRMTLSCTVNKGGEPLEGATVTFEPEKFLGDEIQPASGVTDPFGMVSVSVPTTGREDPPGIAPGLYLIRITKEGVDIPAKFNTETVLGQEISLDAADIQGGLVYDVE